jgi:hypothetical protein
MSSVLSAIVPLVSVLVGTAVTYFFNVRVRRRTNEEDAYQAAISAVAVAEASKQTLYYKSRPASFTEEQYRDMLEELDRKMHESHIERVGEAQQAIARLRAYDPDARYYKAPSEISERPDEIIDLLSQRLTKVRQRRRLLPPFVEERQPPPSRPIT